MNVDVIWGANKNTDIQSLVKMNIKNIFIGYIGNCLNKKYPANFVSLNRRGLDANFTKYDELCTFLSTISHNNIKAVVTFNGLYTEEQYKYILEDIKVVSEFDSVEGIIVNDIGLLLRLKNINYKKKIIISTGGTIFNSYTIEFYKQLGATEFILDRQLKVKEIISILERNKDVNFEIFLLFGNCLLIDGFCSFLHVNTKDSLFGNFFCPCDVIKNMQENKQFFIHQKTNKTKKIAFKKTYVGVVCNLCLLKKLKKYNNIKYKIVTRNFINFNYEKFINKLQFNSTENPKKIFKDIFEIECNNDYCYFSDM